MDRWMFSFHVRADLLTVSVQIFEIDNLLKFEKIALIRRVLWSTTLFSNYQQIKYCNCI